MLNLLDVLAADPALQWVTARVKSIDTVRKKLVLVIGDTSDPTAVTVSGASYVVSYFPKVGDIVHAIAKKNQGVLVLGTTSGTAYDLDARYVNVTGDTMTGNLTVPAGTVAGHAVTLNQMQTADQTVASTAASDTAAVAAKTVGAGNGLFGGGAVSGNPTLHVGTGNQIEIGADTVGLISYAQSITDWNNAGTNGFFMAAGAANAPSTTKTGWWYGWTVAHNGSWCTQFAMPFAQDGIDAAALAARHKQNGVWGPWYRVVNYAALSWDTLDNFIYIRHGGNSANASVAAVSRWAIGNKKDASAAPSGGDEFRIQRYDTAGAYLSKPIYIGSDDGVVHLPHNGGTAPPVRSVGSRRSASVEDDVASNAGSVVDMIADALEGLGIVIPSPAARAGVPLRQVLREILNVVPAETDNTAPEPEPDVMPPSTTSADVPPPESTLTPPTPTNE